MQSQQKKVKWSRGETADALEERTDTGITQVSVSKMENILTDIYGNISRRPAFKTVSSAPGTTDIPVISGGSIANYSFVHPAQSFVFTIDANSYIIFIVDASVRAFGGLLIQDGQFVKRVTITNNTDWTPFSWGWDAQISVAQYNNFMVVSNIYVGDVIFQLTDTNDIIVKKFLFSAPWYAANGTQSKTVSASEVSGLQFNADGLGFTAFAWTDDNGISSPYSLIDTGVNGSVEQISKEIPVGSIVKFPNLGAYMRVEGYRLGGSTVYFGSYTFDAATVGTPSTTGSCVTVAWVPMPWGGFFAVTAYDNGVSMDSVANPTLPFWVQTTSGLKKLVISGRSASWEDVQPAETDVQMFGPLLTPVAKGDAKDTTVTVETGYISLQNYTPTKLAFSNQRLYAAGFYNPDGTPKQVPGYAVGSQIARYNDFKNDYNTQNEAIVVDISTAHQEQIVALVDYNGLKLLTDSAEYSYSQQSGLIKQSENGSLTTCKPLVFGSVCLYADKSGAQIRAMQYELQTDLFTSSSINLMAQKDLIFNTNTMAGNLDKEHYNGRFLYATQTGYSLDGVSWGNPTANHTLAVCNFVPSNQAMIWARWTSPELVIDGNTRHSIVGAVEVNNKIWFVMACEHTIPGSGLTQSAYTLAELDYDSVLDGETTTTDTEYRIVPAVRNHDMFAWTDTNNPDNTVYTHEQAVLQGDNIYDADDNIITTATNSPGGPNIVISGIGYYAWGTDGTPFLYTKSVIPAPTGSIVPPFDESRRLYDNTGTASTEYYIVGYNADWNEIQIGRYSGGPIITIFAYKRIFASTSLEYTLNGIQYTADRNSAKSIYVEYATTPGATVSVFDGDQYMWDDTLDEKGNYTKSLAELTNPRVGFKIDATLESHPIDVGGKTYTDYKRIGKAVAVIRDTEPGAFTVCGRTGYTSQDKKTVNFYGCTGMKNQIRYTIKNIQGAKFTIESLTMIIEYGTLDS